MKDSTRAILERSSDGYTSCDNGCGGMLTDSYVNNHGETCPDCKREVGSKIWWAIYGPGRATRGL